MKMGDSQPISLSIASFQHGTIADGHRDLAGAVSLDEEPTLLFHQHGVVLCNCIKQGQNNVCTPS